MNTVKTSLAGLLACLALGVHAQESEQKCKVTDPTGTLLNVRTEPAGKIIRTIANGRVVVIREYDEDHKGQPWALIYDAKTNKRIGWVIREFVSCAKQL